MGWADNLQQASFRGVRFDVTATDEQISRDHAAYEYPNVDGADLKDLGRKARPFRLTAFIWGDTYEYKLQSLTAALDEPGDGELIHPVYGSIPSVIVTSYRVSHDEENVDSCTVELNFLENNTGTSLFAEPLPEMFGASLFDKLDALNARLGAFFDAVTAPLKTVDGLIKRARTVESTLINTLLTFEDDVKYTASQLVDLAESPVAFVSALGEVLEVHTASVAGTVPALATSAPVTSLGLADTTAQDAAAPTTVIACWGEMVADMDELVALPVAFVNGDTTPTVALPVGSLVSDVADVTVIYSVAAAAELASAATAILSDDDQTDAMTPGDIEKLVNDVRTRLQSTMEQLRSRYEPDRKLITETTAPVGIQWLVLVDDLKTIALNLQILALLVLSRRPPLTQKTVKTDSCLHLLAHLWYADHTRATELQRLNPQIRNPNQITTGMVLNAYAK